MKFVIAAVCALGLVACTEADEAPVAPPVEEVEAPVAPPAEAGPAPAEAVEPTDAPAAVELKLEGAAAAPVAN